MMEDIKGEDEEEKEEADYNEEKKKGKRMGKEDMQDSLVVEEGMMAKLLLVPFANCLLSLQLLL